MFETSSTVPRHCGCSLEEISISSSSLTISFIVGLLRRSLSMQFTAISMHLLACNLLQLMCSLVSLVNFFSSCCMPPKWKKKRKHGTLLLLSILEQGNSSVARDPGIKPLTKMQLKQHVAMFQKIHKKFQRVNSYMILRCKKQKGVPLARSEQCLINSLLTFYFLTPGMNLT